MERDDQIKELRGRFAKLTEAVSKLRAADPAIEKTEQITRHVEAIFTGDQSTLSPSVLRLVAEMLDDLSAALGGAIEQQTEKEEMLKEKVREITADLAASNVAELSTEKARALLVQLEGLERLMTKNEREFAGSAAAREVVRCRALMDRLRTELRDRGD
jgi:hypothetical protein